MIESGDVGYAMAMRLLASGDYAKGWPLYEARTRSRGTGVKKPDIPFPEWTGEDLAGRRLLVWPEQGLGDKIMFARFIPQVGAAEVSVLCEPALSRLFSTNLPADVITASGAVELPDADFWVFYGSLPLRLGITAPPGRPYIVPSAPTKPQAGRSAGVCTSGSAMHPNDANRSLTGADAERLLAIPGAVSLRPEDSGAADLAETANMIAAQDHIVTVDTAVAHLAGAMGKPTSILLPAAGTDWRWGQLGDRTPWYPSARLFRQAPGEPWAAVIERAVGTA